VGFSRFACFSSSLLLVTAWAQNWARQHAFPLESHPRCREDCHSASPGSQLARYLRSDGTQQGYSAASPSELAQKPHLAQKPSCGRARNRLCFGCPKLTWNPSQKGMFVSRFDAKSRLAERRDRSCPCGSYGCLIKPHGSASQDCLLYCSVAGLRR
jgi:hypothetical protein